MKLFHRRDILVGLAVIFLIAMLWGGELQALESRKHILVLNSYHQGLSWTDNIVNGIRSIFPVEQDAVELWIEYMDTKRVFDKQYLQHLYAMYQAKFAEYTPDVIIVSDNNGLNFLQHYHQRLFPGIPVVFCGINAFSEDMVAEHPTFTGVTENPNIKSTLELALTLHPETSRLVIINDTTTTGQANQKMIDAILPTYERRLEVEVYQEFMMDDLLTVLAQLPQKTLVFVGVINRDASGEFFSYEQSMELISKYTQVPVYGSWEFYIGRGVVGGNMITGFTQGLVAAQMALRLLDGEAVADVPILKESPGRYVFDYSQLKRFHLSPSQLPAGSLVVNQPLSWYEQRKVWLASTLGLAGIAAILVMVVRMRTAALRQAVAKHIKGERALKNARDELAQRVEELATLNRITQTVSTEPDLRNMLHMVAEEIARVFDAQGCSISLLNATRTEMTFAADYSHNPQQDSVLGIVISFQDSPTASQALERKRSVIVENAQSSPMTSPIHELLRKRGTHSLMLVLLLSRGEIIGVIGIGSRERKRRFTPEELALADTIAGHIADSIENARLLEAAYIAREEALKAQKASEAANRTKGIFLATMSHELRTPLNGILGYAQLLKRDSVLTQRHHEQLDIIERSGNHLLTLINDILDLAKIESGKTELVPTRIEIESFVEGLMGIVSWRAREKGIQVVHEIAPEVLDCIYGDATRLRQVLLNLLGNAVKFTEHGEVRLRILPHLEPSTSHDSAHSQTEQFTERRTQTLRFEISDTGFGIPPDLQKAIFQPFEQEKDHHVQSSGTGLGLAISQRIVQMMRSQIYVHSRKGEGSTFWFDVEFAEAIPPDTATQQRAMPQSSTRFQQISGYHGSVRKILLVDDNANNRALLRDTLTPLGFELLEASDGQEALELATTVHPDLMLLDLQLPKIDGYEVVRRLRQALDDRTFPIIAVSASVRDERRQKSLEAGCLAFFPKPVQLDRLLEAIGQALGLQWTYTQMKEASSPESVDTREAYRQKLPSSAIPPLQELQTFRELYEMGMILEMQHWLDRIERGEPRYERFTRILRKLVKQFLFEEILEFLQNNPGVTS